MDILGISFYEYILKNTANSQKKTYYICREIVLYELSNNVWTYPSAKAEVEMFDSL